jgi:hypothetical protein
VHQHDENAVYVNSSAPKKRCKTNVTTSQFHVDALPAFARPSELHSAANRRACAKLCRTPSMEVVMSVTLRRSFRAGAATLVALFVLLAVGSVNAAPVAPNPAPVASLAPDAPTLDHFWCYETTANPLNEPIQLKDQFTTALVPHVVGAPKWFCNPVKKRHDDTVTKIIDPDAHLTFLEIGVPQFKLLEVRVRNQFGIRDLKVFAPASLIAVPTKKNNHEFPDGLDHFKCYRVKGQAINVPVGLRDQFTAAVGRIVGKPVLLCNPTIKVHGANTFPINHPREHLVCYKVTPHQFSIVVAAVNQFANGQLTIQNPKMLCVPSRKRVLED